MGTVSLTFDVVGSFTQSIDIMTSDTPEEFVEKIKDGTYWTTLCTPHNLIFDMDAAVVGIIRDTSSGCHTEYTEHEMVEE